MKDITLRTFSFGAVPGGSGLLFLFAWVRPQSSVVMVSDTDYPRPLFSHLVLLNGFHSSLRTAIMDAWMSVPEKQDQMQS